MEVQHMTSEKGKMLLVVEGAKFCKGRRLQSGETHWRCVNKFCRAKLYVSSDNKITKSDLEHSHDVNVETLNWQKISNSKAIFIYQAMTLTKDSVLWNGLPQSGNIASPTFSEKIRNPLNLSLYLHLSNMSDLILRQFKNALSHCNI
jgi:hypothetical protein